MKNLILFVWKHSFFFLFLLLEGIAAFLIVANNSYQRSAFINASNGFTAGILSVSHNFTRYIGLVEANETLSRENARLRSLLPQSFLKHDTTKTVVKDSLHQQIYQYRNAEIISNSFQKRNNYLILNRGLQDSIRPMMGVIAPNGIVGIVKDVSDNFCSVISVLHSKSALDVKIKNNGYTGTLVWKGGDYTIGNVENIPSHVKIHHGDTVLTSGNSSIFPEGILVGYITDFDLKPGANFYTIHIKFSTNYNKVRNVYIVENVLKDEMVQLKQQTEDE
jgi:rod shape-determining protein MreC